MQQTLLTLPQKANFLSAIGEKTPAFVRFSTVTVGREYPDEARNPRGFAIKLYTGEGNYDIVGLNFVSNLKSCTSTQLTTVACLLLPRSHSRARRNPLPGSQPQEFPPRLRRALRSAGQHT